MPLPSSTLYHHPHHSTTLQSNHHHPHHFPRSISSSNNGTSPSPPSPPSPSSTPVTTTPSPAPTAISITPAASTPPPPDLSTIEPLRSTDFLLHPHHRRHSSLSTTTTATFIPNHSPPSTTVTCATSSQPSERIQASFADHGDPSALDLCRLITPWSAAPCTIPSPPATFLSTSTLRGAAPTLSSLPSHPKPIASPRRRRNLHWNPSTASAVDPAAPSFLLLCLQPIGSSTMTHLFLPLPSVSL